MNKARMCPQLSFRARSIAILLLQAAPTAADPTPAMVRCPDGTKPCPAGSTMDSCWASMCGGGAGGGMTGLSPSDQMALQGAQMLGNTIAQGLVQMIFGNPGDNARREAEELEKKRLYELELQKRRAAEAARRAEMQRKFVESRDRVLHDLKGGDAPDAIQQEASNAPLVGGLRLHEPDDSVPPVQTDRSVPLLRTAGTHDEKEIARGMPAAHVESESSGSIARKIKDWAKDTAIENGISSVEDLIKKRVPGTGSLITRLETSVEGASLYEEVAAEKLRDFEDAATGAAKGDPEPYNQIFERQKAAYEKLDQDTKRFAHAQTTGDIVDGTIDEAKGKGLGLFGWGAPEE